MDNYSFSRLGLPTGKGRMRRPSRRSILERNAPSLNGRLVQVPICIHTKGGCEGPTPSGKTG